MSTSLLLLSLLFIPKVSDRMPCYEVEIHTSEGTEVVLICPPCVEQEACK